MRAGAHAGAAAAGAAGDTPGWAAEEHCFQ